MYGPKGLSIVAFPSKQFGGQEFDMADDIAKFVDGYGVTFPLTTIADVNGPGAHPVFAWLKETSGQTKDVRWNFATYWLVDKAGNPTRFDRAEPAKLAGEIEARLNASAGAGAGL